MKNVSNEKCSNQLLISFCMAIYRFNLIAFEARIIMFAQIDRVQPGSTIVHIDDEPFVLNVYII